MEEKEIEMLSEELRDIELPAGLDLEDILKEERGDSDQPMPAEETEDSRGLPEEEPFELPPELSDEAAAQEFPEDNDWEWEETAPKRERRAVQLPYIPNWVLFFVGGMALAAVLAAVAVAAGLEDTAWNVTVTLALAVGCVPMVLWSLDFFADRSRIPAPLIMLAACVIFALAGGVVEAVLAAIIFDLLYAVLESFTGHELGLVYDRLETQLDDMDEEGRIRVHNQLREISGRRLRPVVLERNLDGLILLGVLGVGVVISVLPPLISVAGFGLWIGRAAVLLTVCLYAGETSTLMSTLNAVDSCVSGGLWFSDTNTLNASAEITSVLFNKTGTLTDGDFRVKAVDPVRLSEEQLIFLALCAGAWSNHPLHRAVRLYAGFIPDKTRIARHEERPGYGTVVQIDGAQIIAAGNADLMEELGVRGDMYIPGDTCMFVAVNRTLVGRIDFTDNLRGDVSAAVKELRSRRVANVALMTGDNALNATNVGRQVGITEVYSDCRPSDKVSRLQYILDSQEPDDRLAYVSDRSEDRELLEMANISVAIGEYPGATAVFPDLIIPSGKLTKLSQGISVAKALRRNAFTSFLVSAVGRFAVAVLAVTGVLSLWSAVTVILLMEAGLFFNTRIPDER